MGPNEVFYMSSSSHVVFDLVNMRSPKYVFVAGPPVAQGNDLFGKG